MKLLLYCGVAAMFLLASCTHFYAPALFNNDVSYLPKPASFDSTKTSVYLSGGTGFGQGASATTDFVGFGTLDLSAGHTFKRANLAYGLFGFAGEIHSGSNTDNPNRFKYASFHGAGARLSGNLYKKIDNVDFRFIGFEAVYSKELGDYAAFRKRVYGQDYTYSYTSTRLFTAGLTTEALWHGHNHLDHQYAFRVFAGRTFGSYNNQYDGNPKNSGRATLQSVYLSASYFMQIRKLFGVAEYAVTPSDTYGIPEFKLRIGYKF